MWIFLGNYSHPNSFNCPEAYDDQYWYHVENCPTPEDENDYCGVHINSYVLSHWFYLICTGDYEYFSINPIDIVDASKIVYLAETCMSEFADFEEARFLTILAARLLYYNCSTEIETVTNGWSAVGVGSQYTPTTTIICDDILYSPGYTLIDCNFDFENAILDGIFDIKYKYEVNIHKGFNTNTGTELNIHL